ncbi:MAG: ArsC family reductase [Betaproteobacteria bacterium]
MSAQPITLYGIRNCDTVKKARQWLDDHQLAYTFHDFKTQGVPPERLDHWLRQAGWEVLLNRKGTTWRKLEPAVQFGATDAASARVVMLAHASVVKRPVVEWGNAADVSVGFNADEWRARIKAGS